MIKEETVTVFNVFGKRFFDLEKAEDYLMELEESLNYTYLVVAHELIPEVGFAKKTVLCVKNKAKQSSAIYQALIDTFKTPLIRSSKDLGKYVDNWVVLEEHTFHSIEELVKFKNKYKDLNFVYKDY